MFFESIEAVERYVEPIDGEQGIHRIYDADGQRQKALVERSFLRK